MSFESAVAIAQVLGVIGVLLWLVLPVTAVVCIFMRRRNRPGSSNAFAYIVLAGWVVTIVWCVRSFLAGGWYGEDGPPPWITAILATIMLLGLVAIHFSLIRISALPKEDNNDAK
jgi:hypothetical protein